MSLPAATAPVVALVLAWDETTPAVCALIEAADGNTPDLGSVVVVVPAGPAAGALTQEEFLPLEASLDAPVATAPEPSSVLAAPASSSSTAAVAATLNQSSVVSAATTTSAALAPLASVASESASSESTSLLLASSAASTPRPSTEPVGLLPIAEATTSDWKSVRVLRLSSYSLPSLAVQAHQALPGPTWVGILATPTAPYLGSTEPVPAGSLLGSRPVTGLVDQAEVAPEVMAQLPPALPSELQPEQPLLLDQVAAPLPAAPAAEPLPRPATAPAAFSPDEKGIVNLPATQLSEEVASVTSSPLPASFTPALASWPEALASLHAPAATEAPATRTVETGFSSPASLAIPAEPAGSHAPPTPPSYPALQLAATQFDAPNLNFQIIQYARFAVPLALAEQPFEVIYAPAWPTWLAAQELRQRTGQPLVLHVATLAAGDEPLEVAAGWPAELQRQALHRADLILTETPALAERLRRELGLPTLRVRPVAAADAAAVAQALRTAQTK